MPLIPALGGQRQVDFWVWGQPGLQSDFQDSQGYTAKPYFKKPNKQTNRILFIIKTSFGTIYFLIDLVILCIWVHCSYTDGCEPSSSCWELSSGPLLAPAQRFIYLFYVYEYTVAIQMVVSLHVVVGNWILACSSQPYSGPKIYLLL